MENSVGKFLILYLTFTKLNWHFFILYITFEKLCCQITYVVFHIWKTQLTDFEFCISHLENSIGGLLIWYSTFDKIKWCFSDFVFDIFKAQLADFLFSILHL